MPYCLQIRVPEGDPSKVSSMGEDADSVSISQQLAKGKVIKVCIIGFNMGVRYWQVVNESYKLVMGVKKLTAECLLGYPYRMDVTAPPKNVSGNTLVWSNWKQNQDNPINSASLDHVFEHIKPNRTHLWPVAASASPRPMMLTWELRLSNASGIWLNHGKTNARQRLLNRKLRMGSLWRVRWSRVWWQPLQKMNVLHLWVSN